MASFNNVTLLGNLTRDPELRFAPNGTPIANFGLAVNRRFTQNGEQREEVCYVDIVSFGRTAENVAEYLQKGNLAMIDGRLQWRSWETAEGQKRSKHEVVANNVQFMPRGQTDSQPSGNSGQQRPAVSSYDPTPPVDPAPVSQPATPTTRGLVPEPPAAGQPGGQEGMFGSEETGYGDDDIPFMRSDISDSCFDDRFRADMRA